MKPLEGIRVLDMSRLLPGPMCSWYLTGLGAAVTKIESPDGGDYLRFLPPLLENGQGAWFSAIHAGKESVALDLKQPAHKEAMSALLSEADVLIEGSRPGVLSRLGFDPEVLMERHPRLVIASITGFGQDGPYRERAGHDLGFQALAGMLSLGKREGGVPSVPSVPVADIGGGALTAAMRICAALYDRERTGRGCWLDVSMTEGALAMMAPVVAGSAASGQNPVPGGDVLTGSEPKYRTYLCKDGGLLAVAPLEPKFWLALCDAVGRTVPSEHAELEVLFASRDRDDWVELLHAACCEPVLEPLELADHPQHRARKSVTGQGSTIRVSHPVPGGDESACRESPGLGEHTALALGRVGFDPSQLKETQ